MTIINCITCPDCKQTIFSRALNDFRSCECGRFSIDGGLDYCKINYQDDTRLPHIFQLEIETTPKELYGVLNASQVETLLGVMAKKEEREMTWTGRLTQTCTNCGYEVRDDGICTKCFQNKVDLKIKDNQMGYKENPKTKGSGILCAIPQTGKCPNKCADCFFQSGSSYLEPLADNLPNMPDCFETIHSGNRVVRINDGNDSNWDREYVTHETCIYRHRFFNTAINNLNFPAPVVLTINPGEMTDNDFYKIYLPPKNLMFVRFRCNTWNFLLADKAVEFYSKRSVPIVLTFMAYHNKEDINVTYPLHGGHHLLSYIERKRTLNSYWAITTDAWRSMMKRYQDNKWVYSCGKIEGEKGDTHCRFCGSCLREYFATKVRMGN